MSNLRTLFNIGDKVIVTGYIGKPDYRETELLYELFKSTPSTIVEKDEDKYLFKIEVNGQSILLSGHLLRKIPEELYEYKFWSSRFNETDSNITAHINHMVIRGWELVWHKSLLIQGISQTNTRETLMFKRLKDE